MSTLGKTPLISWGLNFFFKYQKVPFTNSDCLENYLNQQREILRRVGSSSPASQGIYSHVAHPALPPPFPLRETWQFPLSQQDSGASCGLMWGDWKEPGSISPVIIIVSVGNEDLGRYSTAE